MMMASIWALYVLKADLIENYYDVREFGTDKLGNSYPLFITSTEEITNETKEFISTLDEKFKTTSNQYEISMNQLETDIKANQEELMEHFKIEQAENLDVEETTRPNTSDTDFTFTRI